MSYMEKTDYIAVLIAVRKIMGLKK